MSLVLWEKTVEYQFVIYITMKLKRFLGIPLSGNAESSFGDAAFAKDAEARSSCVLRHHIAAITFHSDLEVRIAKRLIRVARNSTEKVLYEDELASVGFKISFAS
jgi:hypothetical protein